MNAAAALAALSLSVLTSDASTEPDACRLKVAEPFSAKSLLALKSDPVLSAYPKCVEARARTLEPSGDGLDRIASQALRACKAERAILAEAMAACGDAKFVRGAMTAEDEIVRMGVRVVVGELRAQHRSPPSENAPQAPE